MNIGSIWSAPLPCLVHWPAHVTSLLLLGLVIAFVIGHGGPPNVMGQPSQKVGKLLCLQLYLSHDLLMEVDVTSQQAPESLNPTRLHKPVTCTSHCGEGECV